eukprot:GHVS01037575.1.p1 GENE.GHVS01037575.1~~GHVS01037575.1.p1  ORF type:complete len:261 (-),score=60.74 GHVS01037575.1:561-1343(-)
MYNPLMHILHIPHHCHLLHNTTLLTYTLQTAPSTIHTLRIHTTLTHHTHHPPYSVDTTTLCSSTLSASTTTTLSSSLLLSPFLKMIVYKDIISGDEVCSDSYKQLAPFDDEALLDVAFEVKSSRLAKGGEDYGISHNTGADDESGATTTGDDSKQMVIDVVDAFKLTESPFTKKDFQLYIKDYMMRIKGKLAEKNPDRVDKFMNGAKVVVTKILGEFDEYTFYTGESFNTEAGLIISRFVGEEIAPRFMYFVDGLDDIKY